MSTTTRQQAPRREDEPEEGQALTPGRLLDRQHQARERGAAQVARVGLLAEEQRSLSQGLQQDLAALQVAGSELDGLQAAPSGGMLDALVRRFRRRQDILARRSIAEGLLQRFEAVSVRLQRASAFSDELQLCALDLQAEVDRLHRSIARDAEGARGAAQALLALEVRVGELEGSRGREEDAEVQRQLDAARFDLRSTALTLELFETATRLSGHQLVPARQLRDTVQGLHEEMASFVLVASGTATAAGHRIQALGMAADAPVVVTELQESLTELGQALESTEAYVQQARRLMDHVLPDLSARLTAHSETQAVVARLAAHSGTTLTREEARSRAERALRDEALAEVESWLRE